MAVNCILVSCDDSIQTFGDLDKVGACVQYCEVLVKLPQNLIQFLNRTIFLAHVNTIRCKGI